MCHVYEIGSNNGFRIEGLDGKSYEVRYNPASETWDVFYFDVPKRVYSTHGR